MVGHWPRGRLQGCPLLTIAGEQGLLFVHLHSIFESHWLFSGPTDDIMEASASPLLESGLTVHAEAQDLPFHPGVFRMALQYLLPQIVLEQETA